MPMASSGTPLPLGGTLQGDQQTNIRHVLPFEGKVAITPKSAIDESPNPALGMTAAGAISPLATPFSTSLPFRKSQDKTEPADGNVVVTNMPAATPFDQKRDATRSRHAVKAPAAKSIEEIEATPFKGKAPPPPSAIGDAPRFASNVDPLNTTAPTGMHSPIASLPFRTRTDHAAAGDVTTSPTASSEPAPLLGPGSLTLEQYAAVAVEVELCLEPGSAHRVLEAYGLDERHRLEYANAVKRATEDPATQQRWIDALATYRQWRMKQPR